MRHGLAAIGVASSSRLIRAEKPELLFGWRALHGIDGLTVADGRLTGTITDLPILTAPRPRGAGAENAMEEDDLLHAIEIRLRVSARPAADQPEKLELGVGFARDEELDDKQIIERAKDSSSSALNVEVEPGDELERSK